MNEFTKGFILGNMFVIGLILSLFLSCKTANAMTFSQAQRIYYTVA